MRVAYIWFEYTCMLGHLAVLQRTECLLFWDAQGGRTLEEPGLPIVSNLEELPVELLRPIVSNELKEKM